MNSIMNKNSKDMNNKKEAITHFNNKYKKARGILYKITIIYLRIIVRLMSLRFKTLKLMIDLKRENCSINFLHTYVD